MLSGIAIATLLSVPALTRIAVRVFMPPRRTQLTCSLLYPEVVSCVHLRHALADTDMPNYDERLCWRIV